MSIISIDDPKEETFRFPNGMKVHMDYGYIFSKEDGMPEGYMPTFNRFTSHYRRSQLFDSNENLVSEVIENNPDKVSKAQEDKLIQEGLIKGDEFEKVVTFPDGKVAKIEYWITPEKRDKNFGRYAANYRRLVLLDEYGEIISEIMEPNPNFRSSGNKIVEDSQDYDDDFLD